jgi:hypothetical protein
MGRICRPAGVPGLDAQDSFHVLEHGFDAPEAASRDDGSLLAFCGGERRVNDGVRDRDGNSIGRVTSRRSHNEKDGKNPKNKISHTRYLSKEPSLTGTHQ